nr:HutD family protein [Geothrix alkalitolerans]
MAWRRTRPSEGRLVPWKNGGGTTLELAVEPPDGSLATGFRWRLSSAEVASSGPFSAFPGLERWLWLLDGPGFDIDFGARGRTNLHVPLVPLRFLGEWPADATLLDGPSVDLNLMVDPEVYRVAAETLRLETSQTLVPGGATTLLFVAQGTVAVPALGLHLGRRHLLRLEGESQALPLAPGLGGASVIRIDLHLI